MAGRGLLERRVLWSLSIIAALSSAVIASGAGAAQVGKSPAALRPASVASTTGMRVSHISLVLAANYVRPGQLTTITAVVAPRADGRIVILRRQRDGVFVNLKSARTNRRGIATFRCSFNTLGPVYLRAKVVANETLRAANSVRAVEQVNEFVLTANTTLALGSSGPQVLLLQKQMSELGYWLGTPNGVFGDATQQAVYALEKTAGLARTGVVDAQFAAALNAGAVPHPRTTSGNAIEVDLEHDLVMFVKNGSLQYVLNTSTGGGYTYYQDGASYVALTPRGVYSIGRVVDGWVIDSLGALWRPRFFYEGFAIHGDTYVPAVPVSHGCVRVSMEAIDWIWAENLAPVGMKVWVY